MAAIPDLTLDAGLPANVDAEKTILGAILLDNAAHAEAAEILEADDFSLDSHRRIYLRMSELIDAQRAVDIVTLANELTRYKEIEAVGGVAYLASLTEGLPRRPVIEDYIRIVKDKSLLRKLMLICSAAIARAADQSDPAIGVLDETEGKLLEVSEKGLIQGFQSARPDCRQLLRHHRQPLQAEPRGHRPGHRFHRAGQHDQRPAEGRADHHRRPSLDGQNRAGHQHRPERGPQPRRHRGHLQPGDEQGVAAAPHAGLPGLGGPAKAAEGLPRPRRPRQAAECAQPTGRVAHLHRRLGRHLAGRDARQGPAAQAERRRPRPGGGGLPAADVGHRAPPRANETTRTAPRRSRPSPAGSRPWPRS